MSRNTAVLEAAEVESRPAERVKARRGRPRRFDFLRGKQTFQKEAAFLEFVAAYPDRDGLSMYIFRLKPKIDFGLIGIENSHIQLITDIESFSREYIEENFGGGEYMVTLNDANARPPERAKGFFRINTPGLEPKLDVRTVCLNDRENADYIEKLIAKGILVRSENGGKPKVKTESDAIPETVTMPGSEAASVLPAAPAGGAAAAAPSPSSSFPGDVPVPIWLKILDRVLTPAPPPPPPPNPIELINIAFQIAERTQPKNEAGPQPIDVLEAYSRVSKLVNPAGAAPPAVPVVSDGGGGASSWVVMLPQIIQSLPQLVQAWTMAKAAAAAAGAAPHSPVMAAPSPGGSAVSAPIPGAADSHTSEVQSMTSLFSPLMISKLGRIVPAALEKFQAGISGIDYAYAVCVMEGKPVYRAICQMGSEGLMAALAGIPHPEVQALLGGRRAELQAWLDDFLSYDVDSDSASDGAETESAS